MRGPAFLHYCQCGNWGAYGRGVSLKNGRPGVWTCGPQGCLQAPAEPVQAIAPAQEPTEPAQRPAMAPEQPVLF